MSRQRPDFFIDISPLLVTGYWDVFKYRDAGLGGDVISKFWISENSNCGKFIKPDAIGLLFSNLIDPIGPRSCLKLDISKVQCSDGISEISQEIEI